MWGAHVSGETVSYGANLTSAVHHSFESRWAHRAHAAGGIPFHAAFIAGTRGSPRQWTSRRPDRHRRRPRRPQSGGIGTSKTKPHGPARAAEIVRDPSARRRPGPRLVGTKLPFPEHGELDSAPGCRISRGRHSTRQLKARIAGPVVAEARPVRARGNRVAGWDPPRAAAVSLPAQELAHHGGLAPPCRDGVEPHPREDLGSWLCSCR